MENNNFWNGAAKYGAILGVLLAVSAVAENLMTMAGTKSLYALMTIEWIAVAVVHYYLLHRYTRSRSMLSSAEDGFSFGQGYAYILTVSGFAGVLVGIIQYIFLHLIVGYTTYMDRMINGLTNMIAQNRGLPVSLEPMFAEMITQLRDTPEPSVLVAVWSGVFSSMLFGAVFGLIIAGVLARAPKPFGTESNE